MEQEETFETQVIGEGRVTIPSYVRKKLGLDQGVQVLITVRKKLLGFKDEECRPNREAKRERD